jgi:hypothetical protein
MYKQMHSGGESSKGLAAEETFPGMSLRPHVEIIGDLIRGYSAKSLLDYGSGKGEGYELAEAHTPDGRTIKGLKNIWSLDQVRLYDPGYEPYAELPTGRFDAVISTDVLEHIPEEDLDWVLDEIFGYARRFVYLCAACYPAGKLLPNGDNAHITLHSPGWWTDLFLRAGARHPGVRWFAAIDITRKTTLRVQGPQ